VRFHRRRTSRVYAGDAARYPINSSASHRQYRLARWVDQHGPTAFHSGPDRARHGGNLRTRDVGATHVVAPDYDDAWPARYGRQESCKASASSPALAERLCATWESPSSVTPFAAA